MAPFFISQSDIHAHEELPSSAGCGWPSEGEVTTIFMLVEHMNTCGSISAGADHLQQLGDEAPQFLN
jgi:hypothetical protein